MKLAELIASVGWAGVRASLLWSYHPTEESLEGYRQAFASLQKLKPVVSSMRLVVREAFREGIDEEPFTDVCGRNGTRNRDLENFKHSEHAADSEYANAETDFSLEFEPWEK